MDETYADDDTTTADGDAPDGRDVSVDRAHYRQQGRLLFDRIKAEARNNTARLDRDRQDWLNLKFYRGGADNQWVVWDRATNRFVTRGTDPKMGGLPEGVPRPVTNIYANKIEGIRALLDQTEPAQVWKPATDDDADLGTSEVCADAVPVLWDEIGYGPGELREQVHHAICLTDKVGLWAYYDTSPRHGTEIIPHLRCESPACATDLVSPDVAEEAEDACPDCGGPLVEAIDGATGIPIGVETPKGRLCARLFQSFELSIPASARSIDERAVPWVLAHSRYSRADALREWPDFRAAIEGGAASGSDGGIQRQYADAMRQIAAPRVGSETAFSPLAEKDAPVVYFLWHDPITDDPQLDLPDGFFGICINDVIVEAGPLPLQDDHGRPVKNILLRTFRQTPGSGYGKPPADDLVPLQESHNRTHAMIQLILMHNAAPRTFVPLSVTLEDPITGMPGEVIRYRSHVPGEAPTEGRGSNPPEGLYKYLEMLEAKFDELSNLNAVLQGARPQGNPTLGEVQILREQGMSAFRSPIDHLIAFEKRLSRVLLWTARQSGWSDRFRQVRGENGSWEIRQFNAADLTGKVDVQVDSSSAWPKSPFMQMLRLQDAFKLGALPPPAMDPEIQAKVLEFLDLSEMKPSLDVDRKQLARELDRWKAARLPQEIAPPDPLLHNLPLHLFLKSQFLKSEEAEELARANPPLFQAMRAHVEQIQMTLAMQQMAQQAAAAGPAARGAKDEAEDEQTPSPLNAAIEGGALRPAGSGGDPLQAAIASGALQPAGAGGGMAAPSVDDISTSGVLAQEPRGGGLPPL
ncbi:MAG: hypothetical protein AB7G23_03005 [Vicinamibacterales bacterium]